MHCARFYLQKAILLALSNLLEVGELKSGSNYIFVQFIRTSRLIQVVHPLF